MRRVGLASLLIVVVLSTQMAGAAVFVGHTNLTIHVRGQTVSGKLVGRPECRPDQTIELWIDGALRSTTTTDTKGNYFFSTPISVGDDVQTRFEGSETGLHPNRFVCGPSLSRIVVVKHLKRSNGEERESRSPIRLAASASQVFMERLSSLLI